MMRAFRLIVQVYHCSQDHATARVITCSADSIDPEDIADGTRNLFPRFTLSKHPSPDWLTGDEFTTVCRVTLSQPEGLKSNIPAPGAYIVRWRRFVVPSISP